MGTPGAYDLQDASLVQLFCHMSHIKEAWELEVRDTAKESWSQGIRADRVSEEGRTEESRPRGGWGRELTFPGVGLRQWMTYTRLLKSGRGVVTGQTISPHLPGVQCKGAVLTCPAGLAGPPGTAGIERPEWVCSALSLVLLPGTGCPQAVG